MSFYNYSDFQFLALSIECLSNDGKNECLDFNPNSTPVPISHSCVIALTSNVTLFYLLVMILFT